MRIRELTVEKDFDTMVKLKERNPEKAKQGLRVMRDSECYPIVNRGQAWYRRLTETQKTDLDIWYQNWLDVTDTFVKPFKPSFVK
jgi:hypothetical protein